MSQASQLTESLGLQRPPIAIAFQPSAPEGMPRGAEAAVVQKLLIVANANHELEQFHLARRA